MYDLIIIGGGPAALAAAFYAQEKQLNLVLIFDQLGGKIAQSEGLATRDWEPQPHRYLQANEHVRLLRDHLHSLPMINDQVLSLQRGDVAWMVQTAHQDTLQAHAVVVATGASPIPLRVPGAERWLEPGGGYSITTYAQRMQGQRVAVIGGTARALQGVAELTQTADHVYLILPYGVARLSALGRALQHHPKVEMLLDAEVTELYGINRLEEVVVQCADQQRRLSVQRAFVDLGLVPNSDLVRSYARRDADGFILINQENGTNSPGLFAAGDCTAVPVEQVFVAMGDGTQAAKSAYQFVLMRRITEAVNTGLAIERFA